MTVWKNHNDIREVDLLKATLITRNDKVFGLFTTETSMKYNNLQNNLADIEKITIAHYEDNAESFRVGTKDHDVSQNIEAFLGALPKKKLWISWILAVALAVTCLCLNLWDTGRSVWMAAKNFAK